MARWRSRDLQISQYGDPKAWEILLFYHSLPWMHSFITVSLNAFHRLLSWVQSSIAEYIIYKWILSMCQCIYPSPPWMHPSIMNLTFSTMYTLKMHSIAPHHRWSSSKFHHALLCIIVPGAPPPLLVCVPHALPMFDIHSEVSYKSWRMQRERKKQQIKATKQLPI